ncbi:FtsX-like permease family protein [Glaciecola sp. MH2013]|uniref:ABC transporter permease n=1 Tax=Glaciecola sp. MH2013 TaxID=2785524 RepID=UPI00189F4528|nr:FtsX-like permease family protein [Glaciecola sp. MH2013]MBF7073479.1 FtsX-like permease family protein [Glaciecola sp. MH2013]
MKTLSLLKELILAYKLRIALLAIASTLAFLTYGVLGSFKYSLNSGDASVSESRLIVTHKMGLMQSLPLAYLEQIQQLPGVESVGHATWQGLYFQTQKNMPMILAVKPNEWFEQHPDMVLDTQTKQRFHSEKDGILVSEALAKKYDWNVGEIIPLKSFIFMPPDNKPAWNYRLTGTFHSDESGGGRNYAITHYDYFDQGRNVWNNTVGTFIVSPTPGSDIMSLAQAIDAHFINSTHPTSSNTDKEFHSAFFTQFGNIVQLISMVTIIVFIALQLIVTSGMTLTVRQMSRQLGILRVIGYSNFQLYNLVLGLMFVIVGSGVALGIATAAGFNVLLTSSMPQFLPNVFLPMKIIVEVLFIAVFIVFLGTLLPGWLALKSSILSTLTIEQVS